MTFERSTDYALIKSILIHPAIFKHVTDDFSGAPEDFRVNDDPRIVYLLARNDNDVVLGLFLALPQSTVCYEIHISMLPIGWGLSEEASRGAFAWIFAHTEARRIVAAISSCNRLAIALAKRAGMTQFGINVKSFAKGGVLIDQVLFGISPS